MYPASFRYHRAASVEDALAALSQEGADARLLAGGASLIPLMKYRQARPGVVIDIAAVAGLSQALAGNGHIAIGAMVRHAQVPDEPACAGLPLLAEVARGIGDPQIRNMGTVGGGLAAAEPTGDWGPALLAARGSVAVRSASGEREVAADDLFLDAFRTSLAPDEMIVEARFPVAGSAGTGCAQVKLEIRAGTSAGSCSTVLEIADGAVTAAGIALGGIERRPVRVPAAEQTLLGGPLDGDRVAAASAAARDAVEGYDDVRGSADFRREVAGALVARGIRLAAERAGAPVPGTPGEASRR